MKEKTSSWAVRLLLATTLAGCGSPPAKDEPKADEPAPLAVEIASVERRDMPDTLSVDGSLVLPEGGSSKLAPTVAGKLVQVNVKEGDRVAAGQLLALVDTRALVAQSQSAAAGAASAQATAAQSEAALKAAEADQTAAVRAARLAQKVAISEGQDAVNQAQSDLQKLTQPPRPPEIAQAQQAIETARAARDKAERDAERDRQLLAEGLVAGSQADASEAALRTAEAALRSAQASLDLLKIGPRPNELAAARERLTLARRLAAERTGQARAALAQAEAGGLNVAAKAQEAAAARFAARQKGADARAAGASVATSEVRAPFDGFVIKRFLNVGDVADPNTPVFAVATSRPSADFVGSLSPEEALRVASGMKVDLGAATGTVSSVGQADPATGLVPVRVHLAGAVRAGGFATARIVLARLHDAAVVPKGAVLSREGKDVVFVVRDGVAHQTEVALGPEQGDLVAVRKGLVPGQKVVVLGGAELSDGAKVEAAEKPKAGGE